MTTSPIRILLLFLLLLQSVAGQDKGVAQLPPKEVENGDLFYMVSGGTDYKVDLGAELDSRDTVNRARENHTGEQAISSITGLQDEIDDSRIRENHTGPVVGPLSSTLTGTVAVTNLSTGVTGTGTLFSSELAVNDSVKIGTEIFTVSAIASNTSLTLNSAYQGSTESGKTAYRDPDLFAIETGDNARKITVTKSGKVGIGTSTPSDLFTVTSSAGGSYRVVAETGTDAVNIIGGYAGNSIGTGSGRSIIAAGGQASNVNTIGTNAYLGVISGGYDNSIGNDAFASTISGGAHHTITETHATIGGGSTHTVSADYAGVFTGLSNTASGTYAVVAGGNSNTASGFRSFVGSGLSNTASGDYAVIPGGWGGLAAGDYSYVFGYRGSTTASADGSVVFKDAVNEAYSLAVANKFGAEFANGYELNGGQVYMESRLGIGTVTGGLGMLRVKQASETANDGIRLGTSDDLGTLRIWHDGTSAQLSEGGVTTMGLDNGKVGAGIAAPLATLHAQSTTEQIRAGYNASNYLSVTTSSTGTTTLDAVGTTPRVEIADITTFTGTSSVGIGVAPGGSGRLRLQQASETANGGIRIETSDAASTLRVWHDGTAAKISEGGIDTLTLEDGKVGVKTVVYSEQASPPTGEADKAIVFAEDNGAGKTRLMVQFGTGAAVQLAIQP